MSTVTSPLPRPCRREARPAYRYGFSCGQAPPSAGAPRSARHYRRIPLRHRRHYGCRIAASACFVALCDHDNLIAADAQSTVCKRTAGRRVQRKRLFSCVEDDEIVAQAVHLEERCHSGGYIGCGLFSHQYPVDLSALHPVNFHAFRGGIDAPFCPVLVGLFAVASYAADNDPNLWLTDIHGAKRLPG